MRESWLFASVMLVLVCCGVSCNSGSTNQGLPGVPVIAAVRPSGLVGRPLETAVFEADASNAPIAWHWTFNGGADVDTLTDATPTVRFRHPGSYRGTVIATNAIGNSAPFPFEYIVTRAPHVPIVTAVAPRGLLGGPGVVLTLSAAATFAPTSWHWEFSGGLDQTSSDLRSPTVTTTALGVFSGTLVASNDAGPSAPFTFNYEIAAGPITNVITGVVPTGPVGTPGSRVSFRAITRESLTAITWNFAGGATPSITTRSVPAVTLGSVGSYGASVTGETTTQVWPPFGFGYEVTAALPPALATRHPIDSSTRSNFFISMVPYQGTLAVAYYDSANKDLKVALSDDADPTDESDWRTVVVDAGGDVGYFTSIAEFNGRLAVSYGDGTNRSLKLARATAGAPILPSDWTTSVIDASGDVGYYTSLVPIGSTLQVAYGDRGFFNLRWSATSIDQPAGPGDWTTADVDIFGRVGADGDLVEYEGNPLIAYRDITNKDLRIARGLSPLPSAGNWNVSTVVSDGDQGYDPSVAVAAGRLVISFSNGIRDCRYVSALTAHPASPADWQLYTLDDLFAIARPMTELVTVHGRIAIAYSLPPQGLKLAVSKSLFPRDRNDWDVLGIDPIGDAGAFGGMTVLDDRLAIAYSEARTNPAARLLCLRESE